MKAKKNQNLFALILDKMGSWSLLILIGVVMAFANSKFLTSSNIINVLRQIAVVTIGAVGVSFVILGGGFDLSTGMIATFAGFAGCVVLLTEGIKALFPKMEGLITQIVSWTVGLVAAMLLWWLDAGFVADVEWYIALLYGFGASLVANGIADTGLVQWLIALITKRTESKS